MNQTHSTQTGSDVRPVSTGAGYRTARRTAAVAGVFSLIVGALLLYDYSRRDARDPFESVAWQVIKLARSQQPGNAALNEEARQKDLLLRREFFRQRAFAATGAWLLLGSVIVFLAAATSAATLHRRLPMPSPQTTPHDVEMRWTAMGRWAVAALALVMAGTAIALSVQLRSDLPRSEAELAAMVTSGSDGPKTAGPKTAGSNMAGPRPDGPTTQMHPAPPSGQTPRPQPNATQADPNPTDPSAPALPPPAPEEIAKMWPRFRGPGGLGISAYANIPDSWNVPEGKAVVWKEAVPMPGNGSPVVWGDRVFLTGATADQRQVYCYDAKTGKLLWTKDVPGTPQSNVKPLKVNDDTGYAAATVVTDGRWVFATFANGDVAAFGLDGAPVWARSLGIPENSYGHASSPALFENLLLIQRDQATKKDGKSRLVALDAATGKTKWEVAREVPSSWPSPIVIHSADRDQIITCGDPWVIAYAPADGAEIWRAKCLRQDVGPSPTFADGIVYAVNEFPYLSAIRADGQGDVTATHVLWSGEDGLPDTASPLATSEYVFLLASYGTLSCYDAKKGDFLWEKEFDASFTSSPSLAGKRLYLFGVEGKAWVVEPGREGCEIVGEGDLGEECVTSPAFQDGRLYIRGKKHLFCIGKP